MKSASSTTLETEGCDAILHVDGCERHRREEMSERLVSQGYRGSAPRVRVGAQSGSTLIAGTAVSSDMFTKNRWPSRLGT
jgi:hypothetical protein